MKTKYKLAHMRAAHLYAELSTARRLKVGALVVKDDRIVSIGYNGMPSGWDNNCEYELEDGTIKTKPEVLHAEMNSLMKLARSNDSGLDASMFITHSPCMDCAKGIYQAGIKEVYYANAYRDDSGIAFLKAAGITVEKIDV
jgi:dCMP deaminase